MNIYISNISSDIQNENLKNLFSTYGEVKSAEIVLDAFNGQPRGFGYVEMEDESAAQKAINELNNTQLQGLVLTVHEAKPQTERKGSYKVGNGMVNVYKFGKK